MFCTKCGKQISDNVSFCPHCGAPVKAEPSQSGHQPQIISTAQETAPNRTPQKRGSAKPLILLGILILIGCFAVLRLRNENPAGDEWILHGEYVLLGSDLGEVELSFDSGKVTVIANGSQEKCQYRETVDSGTLDLDIYQKESDGSFLKSLFSSRKTEITKHYFQLKLRPNGDNSYVSFENGGTYGSTGPCYLFPASTYYENADMIEVPDAPVEAGAEEIDLSGDWQDSRSERCSMTITGQEGNYYTVDVIWASSASEYEEWTFSGYFDQETGILEYSDGNWFSYTEDDSGNLQEGWVLDNMNGQLYLASGTLHWEDSTSVAFGCDFGSSNMRFEKIQ